MSLSLADIKRADVQSFRDVAAGLEKMAAANADMKSGVSRLPIAGDAWKGVSGDAAHHELDGFGKLLEGNADAKKGAAAKIRRAADEFEGVKQLLAKIEQDAAKGKFKIDMSTGKVTPPSGDYDKSELDYLTNTLRQITQAGDAANADLAAAVKAAQTLPDPSGATGAALPTTPTSTVKPGGAFGGVENLVAPKPDRDPGATKAAAAGADTQANYKEWYPKSGVPGKPDATAGALAGSLDKMGIAQPKSPLEQTRLTDPRTTPAPKLDLNKPADRAAVDKFRSMLSAQLPPDQVEAKVAEAIKGAQQDRPMVPTEPAPKPAPGLADGFENRFKAMGEHLLDVTGLNGPDRQIDAVKGSLDGMQRQALLTNNPGLAMADGAQQAINEAVTDYQHPEQIANRTGQHLADAAAIAATAPLGGEGALARTGLEDASIAGRAGLHDMPGGGLPHGLDNVPHTDVPSHPSPVVDHPAPAADHSAPSSGGWNHSTEHYSPQAPQLAADLNNAFTNGHPTGDLAGQVADHATHHAPGIGSTVNPDRVVLGKWAGDDAGYIGEARHNGGIYYDTGGDAWNAIGNGLSRSDADALGWQVNEQFLKTQMENGIPRIDYVTEGTKFSGIADVLRMDPNSFSAKEIKYLIENAPAYGYQRIGDSWVRAGGQ